ncbi:Ubiquinone/menaquinone biosynthesis C-methyltransferase UbiE [Candidatus Burarchaeum australiense]|nr:Ubiquinone/menaquinone biosynthesis C-methyltransferase UbiE [Candidatus Burarchaeum australiense]
MHKKHTGPGRQASHASQPDIRRGRGGHGHGNRSMWDDLFAQNSAPWGNIPSAGAQFALGYFEKKGVRRVLDVACGYGRDANELAQKFEVTGIDSSAEGIRQASENAMQKGVVATFVLGDAKMMPFPPGSFDGVLCNGILSHLTPAERDVVARQIESILRKGGCLVVSEFSIGRRPEEGAKELDASEAGEKGTFREHESHGGEMVHHYFRQEELKALFPAITFEHAEAKEETRSNGKPARLKWVLAGVKR